MEGISVIIPYHNESKKIETTLNLLVNQTLLPNEILLIDSSSTDDSYNVIQIWIQKNASQHNVIFRNIRENTRVPGSSMNVGIRNAAYDILAFMDCGLLNLAKRSCSGPRARASPMALTMKESESLKPKPAEGKSKTPRKTPRIRMGKRWENKI